MNSNFSLSVLLLLLLLSHGVAAEPSPTPTSASHAKAAQMKPHDASDPSAAAVTAANLHENDRFWPFHIDLVERWKPEGAVEVLEPGIPSVLMRVEPNGRVRIAYRGDEIVEVPVEKTDILEAANRVRSGEAEKQAPNLVLAIGQSLLRVGTSLEAVGLPGVIDRPAFLMVYADPMADSFPQIVASLTPLDGRQGVVNVLVPQGGAKDRDVYERLVALGWKGAFTYRRVAQSFTRGFLGDDHPLPSVALLTNEGRLLRGDVWKAGLEDELAAAIDEKLGSATAGSAIERTANADDARRVMAE